MVRERQKSEIKKENLLNSYKYSKYVKTTNLSQSFQLLDIDDKMQNNPNIRIKQEFQRKESIELFQTQTRELRDTINNNDQQHQNNNQTVQYKNHLVSLTYLKKFVKQLLLKVAYLDYRILQKKQLQLLDDNSIIDPSYIEKMHAYHSQSDKLDILHKRNNILQFKNGYQNDKVNQIKQKIFNFFYNTLYLFWMRSKALEPSALVIILWEIFFLCLLIFQLIILPIKGCFSQINLDNEYYSVILYKIPIFCFVVDIFIGFHTGFYEFGKPIMNKKRIALNYISHKFWTDFCCTALLTFNLYIGSNLVDFAAMFLRINQMKIKVEKIDQHFRLSFKYALFTSILKLIVLIIFLAHLTGCGFHLVGDYTNQFELQSGQNKNAGIQYQYKSWINQQGLEDKDWITRYISSIYFSIISMITIGYGDIIPVNIYEKVYVIGITFISCGTFAYCINTIGNIFAQRDQKQKDFESNQYQLQSYLDYMECPQETQIRVLKYFEYLNEQSDEAILKGGQIFDNCSSDLKEEIVRERNMKLLLSIPLFRKNFSKEYLKSCALQMQEKRFGPGETIMSHNQIPLYLTIIAKGDAEFFYKNLSFKRQLQVVETKALALKYFLTETQVPLALRAKTVVTVIQLPYQQFIQTIKNFQSDFEKFCMIRDQMLFDNRYIDECFCCQQYGHGIQDCPQIHYKVSTFQFAKKVFYSGVQEKRMQISRKLNKFNAITNKIHVSLSLKMKRWELVCQIYQDYSDLNITNQLQIKEKDKYFFKRCPKIKQKQINHNQQHLTFNGNYISQHSKTANPGLFTTPQHSVNETNQLNTVNDEVSKNFILQDTDSSSSYSSMNQTGSSSDYEQKNKISQQLKSQSLNDLGVSPKLSNKRRVSSSNQIEDVPEDPLKEQQSIKALMCSSSKKSIELKSVKPIQYYPQISSEYQNQSSQSHSMIQGNNSKQSSIFENQTNLSHQENIFLDSQATIQLQQQNIRQLEPTRVSDFNLINAKKIEQEKKYIVNYQDDINNANDIITYPLKQLIDQHYQIKHKKLSVGTPQQDERVSEKDIKYKKKLSSQLQMSQLNQLSMKRLSSKLQRNNQNEESLQSHHSANHHHHHHHRNSITNNSEKQQLFTNYLQSQQQQMLLEEKQLLYIPLPKISLKSISSFQERETRSQNSQAVASNTQEQDQEILTQSPKHTQKMYKKRNSNYNWFFGQIGLKFEKSKEYLIYFPKNNLSNVIKSYKKILLKQQKQIGQVGEKKQIQTKQKQYFPKSVNRPLFTLFEVNDKKSEID